MGVREMYQGSILGPVLYIVLVNTTNPGEMKASMAEIVYET